VLVEHTGAVSNDKNPRCCRDIGRPRTRPDRVLADKAYSWRAISAHLMNRGIGSVIPEPDDQRPTASASAHPAADR
jgi:hypothetical protein